MGLFDSISKPQLIGIGFLTVYITPPFLSKFMYTLFGLYLLYCLSMYYSTFYDSKGKINLAKNTLFVLAHPDDETVFFTPTVMSMREESNLYLLVLSNGNYEGLGKIREKEMQKAAEVL